MAGVNQDNINNNNNNDNSKWSNNSGKKPHRRGKFFTKDNAMFDF